MPFELLHFDYVA